MSAPTAGADALVTLTHLTLDWPDGTRALDDVSGSFGHGRTGLVGRNGSGKTTLLRLMAGELTPTSGAVHVAGTVATLPQQLGLDTTRTVAEALGIAPVLSAISAIEAGSLDQANFDAAEGRWGIEAEALSALAMLGLPAEPELFDRQLGALSGGEVVTVGLAALQLQRADVALLDEPTNNLDRASRERLVAAVDAWPTQRSLVVVSHDTELLEHVDRIVEVHGRELRSFDGPWSVYRAAIDAEQQAAADAVQAAEQDLRRQKRDRVEAELKLAGRQRIADRDSASKRAPRIIMKTWGMQAEKSAAKHRDIHDDRLQRAESSLADAEARVREGAILHGCLSHPAAATLLEDRLARMSFLCADLAQIRDVLLSALAADPANLREAMAARLGRDPLALLGVEGRAAADPRLRPGADTARAIAALEEALRLHDGLTGLSACVSESAREILSDPAEHIDWRLREAAETAHRATARAVEQDNSLSEDSAWFETQMNRVLTEQAAGKNRRRRL